MQHAIHQRQTARPRHQFHADKGFVALEGAVFFRSGYSSRQYCLDKGVGTDKKSCGPAPDLVSLAFFSSKLRTSRQGRRVAR